MALDKIGIIRFLGTNCDADVKKWLESRTYRSDYIWYENSFNIKDYDMLVLPGGFSHGDYLRCGALAARTPVMKSVREFALSGRPVLGICNGFQVLCEAQLLPGVLLRNKGLKFKDEWASLTVQKENVPFGKKMTKKQKLNLPIAHGDGCFYVEANELQSLYEYDQVWLSYENNPNGSLADIAGVTNRQGNVCGLMPHPERAIYSWMGSVDGEFFL